MNSGSPQQIIEAWVPDTTICVEATSFEQLELWRRYSPSSDSKEFRKVDSWEENYQGVLKTLNDPISGTTTVSLTSAVIGIGDRKFRVVFYEGCSGIVNWYAIEKFIDDTFHKAECIDARQFENTIFL